jgi:hypothetical protein
MSKLGNKVSLLLKIVRIFGLKNLTDCEKKIFNYELKEISKEFLEKLQKYESDTKDLFNIDNPYNDVDTSIKTLKSMLDECGIGYKCGRTSKSNYITLLKPESISENERIIGNFVVNDDFTHKIVTLIKLIVSNVGNLSSGIEYFEINSSNNDIFLKNISGSDFISHIYILFDTVESINTLKKCIDNVTGNIKYLYDNGYRINENKILLVYKYEKFYSKILNNNDMPIKISFNEKYYDYDIGKMTFLGNYVYLNKDDRKKDTFISKYLEYKSELIYKEKLVSAKKLDYKIDKNIKSLSAIYFSILPKNVYLFINGHDSKYNNTELEVLKAVNKEKKYGIEFSAPDFENVGLNCCKIDQISVRFEFDEETDFEIELYGFDNYINSKENIKEMIDNNFPGGEIITDEKYYHCKKIFIISYSFNYKQLNLSVKKDSLLIDYKGIKYIIYEVNNEQIELSYDFFYLKPIEDTTIFIINK